MANEYVTELRPRDFCRESSTGYDASANIGFSNDLGCLTLPKLATQGYTSWFAVDAALTMGTGLTFVPILVDDGANSDDLGKVVRIGITVKRLVSGSDTFDIDTNGATEATGDITLDATAGEHVQGSIAIANAALDSVVVGNLVAVRIRRIGTHANDTCNGRALLAGLYIKNT